MIPIMFREDSKLRLLQERTVDRQVAAHMRRGELTLRDDYIVECVTQRVGIRKSNETDSEY